MADDSEWKLREISGSHDPDRKCCEVSDGRVVTDPPTAVGFHGNRTAR